MTAEVITEFAAQAPVARLCLALELTRADYYRLRSGVEASDADCDVRDQIHRIALEFSSYGYRPMTAELRRRGLVVNHKRVLRLMREDNLLCLRKRAFVVTTDSAHSLPVYTNLVPGLEVTGLDQLWVADITYIRLLREFIYLAVILDAFSRRCIGWALGETLRAEVAVAALEMALATRQVRAGLVHHSDRGVQYASEAYTALLKSQGVRISMSRRGNPYDNAKAERFMRTLKEEEVYLFEYESMAEAVERIGTFLEDVYNQKRLHSAIGYVPPAEFEQSLRQPQPA
jgi:transposase InsO family protein